MNCLSPVAIFVYNRVDNTKKTIERLASNLLAKQTDIFIFSDGAKSKKDLPYVNSVRTYINSVKNKNYFKSVKIIERPTNFYLERNIIEGIKEVFRGFDRIIVLEDDIVTSRHFLEYMNKAFEIYKDEPKVMHVSSFTNLDIIGEHPELHDATNETYFTTHMAGWGWGTWKDRWETNFQYYTNRLEALQGLTDKDLSIIEYGGTFPCLKSLDKTPIPWDVCWEIAIYRKGGFCLTPDHTLVRNIGIYNGTHFRSSKLLQRYNYDRTPLDRELIFKFSQPKSSVVHEELFREAIKHWGIRYNLLGKVIRFIYKKLTNRASVNKNVSTNY